jgi:hypothetical protein
VGSRHMADTDFRGDVHSHTPVPLNKLLHSPFASTWRQDHKPPLDGYGCRYQGSHVSILSTQQPTLPPLSTIAVHVCSPCLPGTYYSIVLFLTQHHACTAGAMKFIDPTTNEEGCLWTQNTVTAHQFYPVPRNKMGNLFSNCPTYINTRVSQ